MNDISDIIYEAIDRIQRIIYTAIKVYLSKGNENADMETIADTSDFMAAVTGDSERSTSVEEEVIFLLALMPHISPHTLDIFFMHNKELNRPYTEFGGWKGISHSGFLPTGETAAFILSAYGRGNRDAVMQILGREHWFCKENILRCEGQGDGEPMLSGRLVLSEEVLSKVVYKTPYHPEYNTSFPAQRITTPLEWKDLVLPYNLCEELDEIMQWLTHQEEIRRLWKLDRIVKCGYRCLFHGPPGTGKTLTAMLLGKHNGLDVYRVDLSMIVSKYIGETEKNLARVFDKAEYHNWILFFDEADALFGQRTETGSSNDRHANQEVAYLLQRIEDFPGIVILATNLKDNIDEAFFRRFQSSLYFPMPDQQLRYTLWEQMLPAEWLPDDPAELLHAAARYRLSGGSIVNVIRSCAIKLFAEQDYLLTTDILTDAIRRELEKEGKMVDK